MGSQWGNCQLLETCLQRTLVHGQYIMALMIEVFQKGFLKQLDNTCSVYSTYWLKLTHQNSI